jgi:hypothetical protein
VFVYSHKQNSKIDREQDDMSLYNKIVPRRTRRAAPYYTEVTEQPLATDIFTSVGSPEGQGSTPTNCATSVLSIADPDYIDEAKDNYYPGVCYFVYLPSNQNVPLRDNMNVSVHKLLHAISLRQLNNRLKEAGTVGSQTNARHWQFALANDLHEILRKFDYVGVSANELNSHTSDALDRTNSTYQQHFNDRSFLRSVSDVFSMSVVYFGRDDGVVGIWTKPLPPLALKHCTDEHKKAVAPATNMTHNLYFVYRWMTNDDELQRQVEDAPSYDEAKDIITAWHTAHSNAKTNLDKWACYQCLPVAVKVHSRMPLSVVHNGFMKGHVIRVGQSLFADGHRLTTYASIEELGKRSMGYHIGGYADDPGARANFRKQTEVCLLSLNHLPSKYPSY